MKMSYQSLICHFFINLYLTNNKYNRVDINAIDVHKDKYYIVPRFFLGRKTEYSNVILVIGFEDTKTYEFSPPLPKNYGVTDMQIYKKKIYFVA